MLWPLTGCGACVGRHRGADELHSELPNGEANTAVMADPQNLSCQSHFSNQARGLIRGQL